MATAEDFNSAIEGLKGAIALQASVLNDRLRSLESDVQVLQAQLAEANLFRPSSNAVVDASADLGEVVRVEPDYSGAIAKLDEVSLLLANWFPFLPAPTPTPTPPQPNASANDETSAYLT